MLVVLAEVRAGSKRTAAHLVESAQGDVASRSLGKGVGLSFGGLGPQTNVKAQTTVRCLKRYRVAFISEGGNSGYSICQRNTL